jgi:hypothetical protein
MEKETINTENLVHPNDAVKELGCINSTFMAMVNSTFLETQYVNRTDEQGRFCGQWYLKRHIEDLKGLDFGALIGFKGSENFNIEFSKWQSRVES